MTSEEQPVIDFESIVRSVASLILEGSISGTWKFDPSTLAVTFALTAAGARLISTPPPVEPEPEEPEPPTPEDPPEPEAGWYVSTTGTSSGAGTLESPSDLQTGLDQADPGDTVLMLGGTYGEGGADSFTLRVSGTAASPITLRPAAGQTVIVDGGFYLSNSASHWIIRDAPQAWFVFTNSAWMTRYFRLNDPISGVIIAHAIKGTSSLHDNIQLINLVAHDCWEGFETLVNHRSGQHYGLICYNQGYKREGERGHGHHEYIENKFGQDYPKFVEECFFGPDYDWASQVYGGTPRTTDLTYRGNTHANCHAFFSDGTTRNVYDANWFVNCIYDVVRMKPSSAGRIDFRDNYLHARDTKGNYTSYFWLFTSGQWRRNIIVSPSVMLEYRRPSDGSWPLDWQDNDYYDTNGTPAFVLYGTGSMGASAWDNGGYDTTGSTFHSNTNPGDTVIEVRPNKYEIGRGIIRVRNWPGAASVTADLSGLGYANGDTFEIRNLLNLFGDEPITGTYNSAVAGQSTAVAIDMQASRWTVVPPYKHTESDYDVDVIAAQLVEPWPTHGVFLIRKT